MEPLPDQPAPPPSVAGPEGASTPLSNTGPETAAPPAIATAPDHGSAIDWGIDTVKVSFPVDLAMSDATSSFWRQRSSRNLRDSMPEAECLTGFYDIEGGQVRVSLYTARSRCTLHFNAARIADPTSKTSLLHPDALSHLVRLLLEVLSPVVWPAFVTVADGGQLVWPEDWADDGAVRRLDIARNLQVSDPDVVKATLPKIRCAYGKQSVVHHSSLCCSASTAPTRRTRAAGTGALPNWSRLPRCAWLRRPRVVDLAEPHEPGSSRAAVTEPRDDGGQGPVARGPRSLEVSGEEGARCPLLPTSPAARFRSCSGPGPPARLRQFRARASSFRGSPPNTFPTRETRHQAGELEMPRSWS